MKSKTLYLISFIDCLATGLVFPFYAGKITALGGSFTYSGILIALFTLMQSLSSPIISDWAETRGHRAVLSLILLISGLIHYCLASVNSLSWMLGYKILLGFFMHTPSLCKTIASTYVRGDKLASLNAKLTACSGLGFALGPLIGVSVPAKFSKNGFQTACVAASLLHIVNICLVANLSRIRRVNSLLCLVKNASFSLMKNLESLWKIDWADYWDIILLKFLNSFAITVLATNFPYYASKTFNLNNTQVAYLLSYHSFLNMIMAIGSGFFIKRIYPYDSDYPKRALHSHFIMSVTLTGLYLTKSHEIFHSFLIPLAVGVSLFRTFGTGMLLLRSEDDEEQELLIRVMSVITMLATFSAPIASGVMLDSRGHKDIFLYCIIPSVLGVFISTYTCYKGKGYGKED